MELEEVTWSKLIQTQKTNIASFLLHVYINF